jgi:hypothetical protein
MSSEMSMYLGASSLAIRGSSYKLRSWDRNLSKHFPSSLTNSTLYERGMNYALAGHFHYQPTTGGHHYITSVLKQRPQVTDNKMQTRLYWWLIPPPLS